MSKAKWVNKALRDTFASYGGYWNPKNKDASVQSKIAYALAQTSRMFHWTGLPESIPENVFELILQTAGAAFRPNSGEGSEFVFWASEGGEPDVYYRPSQAIVANPALNLYKEYEIGEDVTIFRNDTLQQGLIPMHSRYARELMENELTLYNVSILSRALYAMVAADDNDAAAADAFIEALESGDMHAIHSSSFWERLQIVPTANNPWELVKALTEREQYLASTWKGEYGLEANWNAKREATNEAEAGMGIDGLLPLVDDMLACRREGCDAWNKLHPDAPMSVELAGAWKRRHELADAELEQEKKGGDEDVQIQDDNPRPDAESPDEGDGSNGDAEDSSVE